MPIEIIRPPQWPKDWPSSIPAHLRWPQKMGLIGAWPNKWLVTPVFGESPPPFSFAEETLFKFWKFDNGQYIWKEETPLVTPNIESFLLTTMTSDDNGLLVYVTLFRFVGPFASLLYSKASVNVSHTPEGEVFMGQTATRRQSVHTTLPGEPGISMISRATAGWTDQPCL